MHDNLFFVLGAPDPEMHEIEAVLKAQNKRYAYAHVSLPCYKTGRISVRCKAESAYAATDISSLAPHGSVFVFVECAVAGIVPAFRIDHHSEGDPGYDAAPIDYLKGSSLGQLLTFLKMEPTPEQRIICAADHCLAAAYQGQCPGVSPEDLRAWRLNNRSTRQGVPVQELEQRLSYAKEILRTADQVEFEGETFPWIDFETVGSTEIAEASAQLGQAFMSKSLALGKKVKFGIYGASPRIIQAWMSQCGLARVYGNPHRGYAGGYES